MSIVFTHCLEIVSDKILDFEEYISYTEDSYTEIMYMYYNYPRGIEGVVMWI